MIIYLCINKINGMKYIGQTINSLEKRISVHKASKDKKDTYFSRAIKKYGEENFKWKILEKCKSKEELDEMEFHYIKQYNTLRPNGYNLTLGGEGNLGWKPSKETKKKIGAGRKKAWDNVSEEYKKEWGRKSRRRNSGKNNPMYGTKRKDTVERNCINIYNITSPIGDSFITRNLRRFITKYNELNYSGVNYHIQQNTDNYKGWKFIRNEI